MVYSNVIHIIPDITLSMHGPAVLPWPFLRCLSLWIQWAPHVSKSGTKVPQGLQKSEFHVMQYQLFTKAAITLKLEALFVQNLTLRISTVGFVFVQFIELIRLTLINRDAK